MKKIFCFILLHKMEEVLNIKAPVIFDDSLANYEIYTHQPYASSSYKNSNTIVIAIQQQDRLYTAIKEFFTYPRKTH